MELESLKPLLLERRRIFEECWEYIGRRNNLGYGQIYHGGKHLKVHRIAHAIFIGPIPEGMSVLHKCDNRPCFNPDHLFLGTQQDNVKDMISKGRAFGGLKGTDNGRTWLHDKDVKEIFALLDKGTLTQKEIGDMYGIAQTTVSYIKRVGWSHLREAK